MTILNLRSRAGRRAFSLRMTPLWMLLSLVTAHAGMAHAGMAHAGMAHAGMAHGSAAAAAATAPDGIRFTERTVTTPDGEYKYLLHIPAAALDRRRKPPVIVFLHGVGERGDDNAAQTRNGIRLLIAQGAKRFPAVVVVPQCRPGVRWTQPAMEAMVMAALDRAMAEFGGDPDRVYLTGLSMGGNGVWELARRHPVRWAAIAPVCAGVMFRVPPAPAPPPGVTPVNPYSALATAVSHIPAWIFHGDADEVVPVSESREMAAILYARKADVRYTEYPGVAHDSWDHAYKEPAFLGWLLAQKRKK